MGNAHGCRSLQLLPHTPHPVLSCRNGPGPHQAPGRCSAQRQWGCSSSSCLSGCWPAQGREACRGGPGSFAGLQCSHWPLRELSRGKPAGPQQIPPCPHCFPNSGAIPTALPEGQGAPGHGPIARGLPHRLYPHSRPLHLPTCHMKCSRVQAQGGYPRALRHVRPGESTNVAHHRDPGAQATLEPTACYAFQKTKKEKKFLSPSLQGIIQEFYYAQLSKRHC